MVWDGKQLKYGCINPEGKTAIIVGMGASEVIKAASGRFVKTDGSGRMEIAGDGHGELFGFVELEEQTCSATEGKTKATCIIDVNALFKIPINSGTFAAGMIGDTCDLSVVSTIQGAQLDASAEDTIQIVDGDLVNNKWVIVRLNPAKLGATGVA
jgi:hypothetical protein